MARFDSFYPADSPRVRRALTHRTVRLGETGLMVGAYVAPASAGDDSEPSGLQLVVRFVDFGSEIWAPTAAEGVLARGTSGIVLARKAAQDFGVGVGDQVVVTLPEFVDGTLAYSTRPLTVAAIHPHPLRVNAYMDLSAAANWGLEGLANVVTGAPSIGNTLDDVKRSLFGTDTGVELVQGLDESFKSIQDSLDQSAGVFVAARGFVFVLLLLIAFNTANINVDERARDHRHHVRLRCACAQGGCQPLGGGCVARHRLAGVRRPARLRTVAVDGRVPDAHRPA